MKNNDTHREFRLFMLPDYEKEEEYLREMHRDGWKFTHVTLPGIYPFEKCEPEDVVYRLDFNPQTPDKKRDYVRMFEDYGWEYLQDLNEFSYFRKSADEEDTEIFSDIASKLDMMRRILAKRMIPVLVVFLCCMVPNIVNILRAGITHVRPYECILLGILFGLFGLYVGMITHCFVGFRNLARKYSGEE